MAWYQVVFLVVFFGGFAVFAGYTEIKRVREYSRTEQAKRKFMEIAAAHLDVIAVSLKRLADKN